jgi:phosphate transport system permease protein
MAKISIHNLRKRHKSEKFFKRTAFFSVCFSLFFLVTLFGFIFIKSNQAFWKTKILLEIDLSEFETKEQKINYRLLIKNSLRDKFSEAKNTSEINSLYSLISKISAFELKKEIEKNENLLGNKFFIWLSASSKADVYFKYKNQNNLNQNQEKWLQQLIAENRVSKFFNFSFFEFADSREPEIAGIKSSLIGSFLVMLVFLVFAFPIGVMSAFYLEEFAPKNKITDLIEISFNNLAAIPSIIYGLLGLTIYLQIMSLPRSSSFVGGATLFMLVLPVITISTRNTIRSIPASIRDAALGLGASKMQIAIHHLLPLSMPGIMTGTILAVSRALGETAPLLMIGMVAFIADVPKNFFDPATVLPVQIYLWSDSPEIGFSEKTSAAILILLTLLIIFNSLAIFLRKKFEIRW